jgi:NADH-quinone oxidoreductase subunit E
MKPTAGRILTDEIRDAIRACFPRYPTRQAALLPALHVVNERLGYVPPEAVVEIADLLKLAPAEVQDTLSFYGFFAQDQPRGRATVWFCQSCSCAARGSEGLLVYLCEKLGIRPGETTPDGRVTVRAAECLGACDAAPAMLANDVLHRDLTGEKIDQFIEEVAGSQTAPKP